jgi:hypothetical protein
MEGYYRILLLIALIGIAVGIAGVVLELRLIALVGCLAVPAAAYVMCVIRTMTISDSGGCRSPIPVHGDQSFRCKAITDSG